MIIFWFGSGYDLESKCDNLHVYIILKNIDPLHQLIICFIRYFTYVEGNMFIKLCHQANIYILPNISIN